MLNVEKNSKIAKLAKICRPISGLRERNRKKTKRSKVSNFTAERYALRM